MTGEDEGWLALNLVEGIGQKTIRFLLHRFGGTESLLEASAAQIQATAGIDAELAARIASARKSPEFLKEMALVAEHGVGVLTLGSEGYPLALRETDAPPPALYFRGEFPFGGAVHLAVVGTRNFTRYGEKTTRRLIAELAGAAPELVIVSGLARGIDTVAHRQALESGLKTVAVMAGGLTGVYPPENASLAEEIVGQGAVISEFPMAAPPLAKHFPIRNRIISGLSAGILVVEAGEKSGALITAGFGLHHNREVFAVPGNADLPSFRGTNRLIQKGHAKLVWDAAEILSELQPLRRVRPEQLNWLGGKPADGAAHSQTGEKGRIVAALEKGPLHPDDLSEEMALPVEKLLGILLEMELAGEIYQTSENQYALS